MKKIIIPLAAVVLAGAAAGIVAFSSNRVAADKPAPPEEIPSGNYYVDGDPENDELYLVVDGKTIHFESSIGLREAFKNHDRYIDERYLYDEDALEHQVDVTMEDWGDDSYTYTLKNEVGDTNDLNVLFRIAESEFGYSGQGIRYITDSKTLSGWAGDFVLAE